MSVSGHVDGLEGCYITGWAVRGPGICDISIVSEDGVLIARGDTGYDRPDLSSLGLGRTNVAFRILLPESVSGTLHVFAEGLELPNSPVEVGSGLYSGRCFVNGGVLHGWVTERVLNFNPPVIRVTDQDGRVVAEIVSEFDDFATDPGFRPARFHVELDQSCFGRGELLLTASANDYQFASVLCNLPLEGNIEELRPDYCSGWLFSPDAPERRFQIEVYRDGTLVGTARCQLPRADVKAVFLAADCPGFAKPLRPATTAPLDFTSMAFRLPGSKQELFGGPFIVGSRAAAVMAARRVAHTAHLNESFSPAERAILQAAISGFLGKVRQEGDHHGRWKQLSSTELQVGPSLNILVPVYRGVDVTRACIESVVAHCDPARDRLVLLNDQSPESGMAEMLASFGHHSNVIILENDENLGFVGTINRGFAFCTSGDVILLNSDTKVFPGGLEELRRIANSAPDIGTVTAISNNATIFSYPHPDLRKDCLDDVSWAELADIALVRNRDVTIDVPTGHGFCMYIKREVLTFLERFDTSFGKGYGEENDFCARAADLGYRNIAAPSVIVEHKESISFLADKSTQLAVNLPRLQNMYPEYTPTIIEIERRDDLRSGRWALDAARLTKAGELGQQFALVVQHALGGGTHKAIADIETAVGYDGAEPLTLSCRSDGVLELTSSRPSIRAVFGPDEVVQLFDLLSATPILLILVHQLLGYTVEFAELLKDWVKSRHAVLYIHDFYPFCSRVTMIDATGKFCGAAPVETCERCLALAGPHEASRFRISPAAQRALFAELFRAHKHVVTPSGDAAAYLRKIFSGQTIDVIPHPEQVLEVPVRERNGANNEVILLGAIGPHKGSLKLLEIAQHALMTHPWLRFRVIGYTDIDDQLLDLGNVTITGKYKEGELHRLCREASGRLALFLSVWPETYSYTLSEAAREGFVPVVPNVGALAERVTNSGFGVVFPFPIEAAATLQCLEHIQEGKLPVSRNGAGPSTLLDVRDSPSRTRRILSRPTNSLPHKRRANFFERKP